MADTPPFWSRAVTLAAAAGLVPFLVGLVLTLWPDLLAVDRVVLERAMLGYGALCLSFLGGVRWGMRLQGGPGTGLTFIAGIGGAVLGLISLVLALPLGLAVLIVGFGAHGAWDVWSGFRGALPQPYAQLRLTMTWLVCAALAAILAAGALA